MIYEHYTKACKAGRKDYQYRRTHGMNPTLEVLEDLLPASEAPSMMSLGLVQIPMDQIVGTRYSGRSFSFAGNFMPIMDEESEFASKWDHLSIIHETEGIRDPIKAYEYMNKFYVEEGNKRVSVLKFFGADSVPGMVTRLLPKHTDELENKIYFEFVEFYKYAKINYIWFSREGSFARLQTAFGKGLQEEWTDDDRLNFSSLLTRFTAAYQAKGGKNLKITVGDAFLSLLELYGYEALDQESAVSLKALVSKSWEEFEMLQHREGEEVLLKTDPTKEKKTLMRRLFGTSSGVVKAAFIYQKNAQNSSWTYAHELGRTYLEQTFPEEVQTICYDNVTEETIGKVLEEAIAAGCRVIFTAAPPFAQASVKAAIAHPHVRILNCSLNTSHRYIRTYYPRMHEAKFLMGAIAGALAENDRLLYVADYPLFGTIAHINAFALGAKMVNPRARIYLRWSTSKDYNLQKEISEIEPSCISCKDMVVPEDGERMFGIYHVEEGHLRSVAMPYCHWGKFYEKLIRQVMEGTWNADEEGTQDKAINYWWGMSSGIVDVISSNRLPIGTGRLVELLKNTIMSGEFQLFSGPLYSQKGLVSGSADQPLTLKQIVEMDWLADNVIGEIPDKTVLNDQARPVLEQQGVTAKKADKKG